jgi:hypothetical protein
MFPEDKLFDERTPMDNNYQRYNYTHNCKYSLDLDCNNPVMKVMVLENQPDNNGLEDK